MTYRIGVDVGGTFTDFTVAQGDGALLLWKEDTTPEDPGVAVLAGLKAVAEQLGSDLGGLLRETELLVHGTTVATNMLIQRNGPTIGLLCTEGFRDSRPKTAPPISSRVKSGARVLPGLPAYSAPATAPAAFPRMARFRPPR